MQRREFIVLGGAALAARPLATQAQQASKVHRVGVMFTTSPVSEMAGPEPIQPRLRAFVHGLRERGYIEGQNLVLERRSAEGKFERFGEIVAELVGRKVDVIVTVGNEAAVAAKRVTSTAPIVVVHLIDPVEVGIVASLARPGSNITGFTFNAGSENEAKRLQMLKEAVPAATRIAFLGIRSEWEGPQGTIVRAAAPLLGVTLVYAEHSPTHYADAFALIARERPQALFVARHPALYPNRQLIVDFAVAQRLPCVYPYQEFVEAGGLMSYGTDVNDVHRRAAGHVDRILKGAKPADIPVEQPTKFELVINLKTAKALGLTIPPSLLAVADEVIE
jgi:putative tryptophan/tyrosine transport system substrate-binding protein